MNLRFWAARPWLIPYRLRYWVWERLNSDKPWLCPGTVAFCERTLDKSMSALEFGSGRSTRWLAGLVGHVTSIEHDRRWFEKVAGDLNAARLANVDYRHVPLDHDPAEGERPDYDPAPAYVAVVDHFSDDSLDLVVVDGHYRTHCVRHAVPKIRRGGFLLVDDANLWPDLSELRIPKGWRVVDDSSNGIKRCLIWQRSSDLS